MQKLILNCDTGIDDAFALAYAASQQTMELIGVVASYGMSYVGNTYRNSKHILRMLGCNAPVFAGSEKPLEQPLRNYLEAESLFHGGDGVANLLGQYTQQDVETVKKDEGIDFIIESTQKYGKDLTLVTTGPLTDLARVLQKAPWVKDKIGSVVSMVGALAAPGNATAFAEANAILDVEATKFVLESDLPLTVVGLDITRKTLFSNKDLARWEEIKTQSSDFFVGCAKHYLNAYRIKHSYLPGCGLHDPLAVGVALHPDWIQAIPIHLTCEIEGEAKGRTCESLALSSNNTPARTQGALRVDAKAFEQEFFATVEGLLKTH